MTLTLRLLSFSLLCLASCVSDTRYPVMLPQGKAVGKKRTPEGTIVYDPLTLKLPGQRMHWHGGRNAAKEANGLGMLTVMSKEGAEVTDSELGVMKSGRFEGIVYANHKFGGQSVWRYEQGRKYDLVFGWENRFFEGQKPDAEWVKRFPPIGDPKQNWNVLVDAERSRRAADEAKKRELEKRQAKGELSPGDLFVLRLVGGFMKMLQTPTGGGSGGYSSGGPVAKSGMQQNGYRGGRCTFDDKAFQHARESGSNLVHVRIDGETWEISYDFGGGHGYLIKGDGSLEGRTIEVLFGSDGRPARVRCSAGSGTCPVYKSWRQ